MPDLTIEHIRTCQSNIHWQTVIKGSSGNHTVTFGEGYSRKYSHGWNCTCPAFQFQNKRDKDGERTCKHIEQAKPKKCSWNHEAFMGSHADANPDGTCPDCGGATTVIRVGV